MSTAAISPLAGKPAPKEMLVDVGNLEREYFERKPDPDNPTDSYFIEKYRWPSVLDEKNRTTPSLLGCSSLRKSFMILRRLSIIRWSLHGLFSLSRL